MLTSPGMVLGTAGYLAPEQARGEPATPASDRYALGVVAFELLTGRRPYAGDTPTTEAFAHLNASIREPTTSIPRCLRASTPSSRPHSRRIPPRDRRRRRPRVAAARGPRTRRRPLSTSTPTRVYAAEPAPARSATPAVRPVYRTRHRRGPLVVGAAALLLVLGFLAVALARSNDDFPSTASRGATRSAVTTTSIGSTSQASATKPDGAALNHDGFARMQVGDYAGGASPPPRAVARVERARTRSTRPTRATTSPSRGSRSVAATGSPVCSVGPSGSRATAGRSTSYAGVGGSVRAGSGDESDDGGATGKHGDNEAKRPGEGKGARSRLGRRVQEATISPVSGKRPRSCFENTRRPSTKTSNWPRPPGWSVASMPIASASSAARPTAVSRSRFRWGRRRSRRPRRDFSRRASTRRSSAR